MAADAAKHGIHTTETTGWVEYPIPPDVVLYTQMHLGRGQVAELIRLLQHWLETGQLSEDKWD
jgi:hypothetical protein